MTPTHRTTLTLAAPLAAFLAASGPVYATTPAEAGALYRYCAALATFADAVARDRDTGAPLAATAAIVREAREARQVAPAQARDLKTIAELVHQPPHVAPEIEAAAARHVCLSHYLPEAVTHGPAYQL